MTNTDMLIRILNSVIQENVELKETIKRQNQELIFKRTPHQQEGYQFKQPGEAS